MLTIFKLIEQCGAVRLSWTPMSYFSGGLGAEHHAWKDHRLALHTRASSHKGIRVHKRFRTLVVFRRSDTYLQSNVELDAGPMTVPKRLVTEKVETKSLQYDLC